MNSLTVIIVLAVILLSAGFVCLRSPRPSTRRGGDEIGRRL